MERLSKIKLFLFDMDGTLYLGDRLYDFTPALLEAIKKSGGKYMFMTNNSSKSVVDYIKKLEDDIEVTKTACWKTMSFGGQDWRVGVTTLQ